jgi:hypothetical protein
MNNLSNSEVTRQPPHRAHRGATIVSSHCSARMQHRKERSESATPERATSLNDELELVEIRYQALRARMAMEELFSEGLASSVW